MTECWEKKSLRDIDVCGKKVIVRVDFNVPLDENKQVTDDNRLRRSLPTIECLQKQGAKIILMSHLGRPKGVVDLKYSLAPVVERLSQMLNQKVLFAEDCVGSEAARLASSLQGGQILLLENLRFYTEEQNNDPVFAKKLADLADIYVDDAFGTAHREHASIVGITKYLPAVCGLLLEKELTKLGATLKSPARPFVSIIGGAKVADKIDVIESLLQKVDKILIGGGMAYTFFAAQGYDMQKCLVDESKLAWAKELLSRPEAKAKIVLPIDTVVAAEISADAPEKVVSMDAIPAGWMGLDIGPETIKLFRKEIDKAQTIIWNGPCGVFEIPQFARGTMAIAKMLAESSAYTIVGGGDSVAAVRAAKVVDVIDHVSTGGGASLKLLQGKRLPGVVALDDK
ncbi:MAG: phosphoglycerate kinase [Bacillota bacterium]|jgi:phosphoglycerate kinase